MDTSITPLSTTVSSSSADNAPQPQQNQFMEPLPPPSVAETEYTLSPVPSSKATEKKGRFTIKNASKSQSEEGIINTTNNHANVQVTPFGSQSMDQLSNDIPAASVESSVQHFHSANEISVNPSPALVLSATPVSFTPSLSQLPGPLIVPAVGIAVTDKPMHPSVTSSIPSSNILVTPIPVKPPVAPSSSSASTTYINLAPTESTGNTTRNSSSNPSPSIAPVLSTPTIPVNGPLQAQPTAGQLPTVSSEPLSTSHTTRTSTPTSAKVETQPIPIPQAPTGGAPPNTSNDNSTSENCIRPIVTASVSGNTTEPSVVVPAIAPVNPASTTVIESGQSSNQDKKKSRFTVKTMTSNNNIAVEDDPQPSVKAITVSTPTANNSSSVASVTTAFSSDSAKINGTPTAPPSASTSTKEKDRENSDKHNKEKEKEKNVISSTNEQLSSSPSAPANVVITQTAVVPSSSSNNSTPATTAITPSGSSQNTDAMGIMLAKMEKLFEMNVAMLTQVADLAHNNSNTHTHHHNSRTVLPSNTIRPAAGPGPLPALIPASINTSSAFPQPYSLIRSPSFENTSTLLQSDERDGNSGKDREREREKDKEREKLALCRSLHHTNELKKELEGLARMKSISLPLSSASSTSSTPTHHRNSGSVPVSIPPVTPTPCAADAATVRSLRESLAQQIELYQMEVQKNAALEANIEKMKGTHKHMTYTIEQLTAQVQSQMARITELQAIVHLYQHQQQIVPGYTLPRSESASSLESLSTTHSVPPSTNIMPTVVPTTQPSTLQQLINTTTTSHINTGPLLHQPKTQRSNAGVISHMNLLSEDLDVGVLGEHWGPFQSQTVIQSNLPQSQTFPVDRLGSPSIGQQQQSSVVSHSHSHGHSHSQTLLQQPGYLNSHPNQIGLSLSRTMTPDRSQASAANSVSSMQGMQMSMLQQMQMMPTGSSAVFNNTTTALSSQQQQPLNHLQSHRPFPHSQHTHAVQPSVSMQHPVSSPSPGLTASSQLL